MTRAALWLVITVSFLFLLGLLMIFNTTAAEIIDRSLEISTHAALFKQLGYGLIGVVIGLIIYRCGYESLIRYSLPLLIFASILLVLVLIPGVGMKINGARRWLGISGFPLGQPSEGVKILIPVAFIYWFSKQKRPMTPKPFLKMLGLTAIPLALILFEPDNGTVSILCLLLIILFFLSKIPLFYWAVPLFALMLVGAGLAYQMPHVQNRLEIYLNPELDLKGKGHQPHQAKIAAGSGQLFGRGIGESLQKLNYLPEARSDYIAAIYAEETGFLGILLLVALYVILSSCGFIIAIRSKRIEPFLLAAILTFLISIQAFLNLGIVSGLLPSKGMTLPFFSQGGSSLVINIICMFLLLDISRKEEALQCSKS